MPVPAAAKEDFPENDYSLPEIPVVLVEPVAPAVVDTPAPAVAPASVLTIHDLDGNAGAGADVDVDADVPVVVEQSNVLVSLFFRLLYFLFFFFTEIL